MHRHVATYKYAQADPPCSVISWCMEVLEKTSQLSL